MKQEEKKEKEKGGEETNEAGRVIVTAGLGVTKGLEHGDGLEHHGLDVTLAVGTGREELQDELGGLSLTGSRLSGHEDGLVDAVLHHGVVRGLGDGKDVRGEDTNALSLVVLDPRLAVDGQALEGVDGHKNGTRVGLHRFVVCFFFVQTKERKKKKKRQGEQGGRGKGRVGYKRIRGSPCNGP